jgi:hypothetical protein
MSNFSLFVVGTDMLASTEPVQPGVQAAKRVQHAGTLGSGKCVSHPLAQRPSYGSGYNVPSDTG